MLEVLLHEQISIYCKYYFSLNHLSRTTHHRVNERHQAMQICQRILQRRCGKQELRNPMRQIIEILCTLCPMEDIPEIVRLINDKEVPFDMAKTPDQFG